MFDHLTREELEQLEEVLREDLERNLTDQDMSSSQLARAFKLHTAAGKALEDYPQEEN